MKKLIFTLSILLTAIFAQAQIGCFWHEDFDPTSLDDSVVSSTNNASNPGWDLDQRLFVTAPNSDSAYLGQGDTVILATTPVMNLTGMTYVLLDFDQICKISFFDKAILEYSWDGTTWTQMQDDANGSNVTYLGAAPFYFQLSTFSTASYGVWYPGSPDSIPTNAWWQHESFDISGIAGNVSTFQMRFKMYDDFSDLTDTLNGWHIDNICVTAAPCELQAPEVYQLAPIWNNITYSLGPFDVNDSTLDAISGIQNSWLIYTINGSTPDTIDMTVGASLYLYSGQIPAVNAGDTVCYYITVMDGSGCGNVASTPQHCFVASAGITFPYCLETFDASVLWTDTTVSGSSWELGTPAWGQTTGALSPPNAWDIELSAPYQFGSLAYLYSPVFSFAQSANARITFWLNYNTSVQEDGAWLEYRKTGAGGPWTTLGDLQSTNGCGCEQNWYDNVSFNNGHVEWDGTSGGWKKADFIFPDNSYSDPQFQFRFVFQSSTFTQGDGISIDDFCFTLPEPDDPGLSNIVSPVGNAPEGSCLPVTVTIHNYGSNTITTSDVYYVYDGTTNGPFTWTGSLDPGQETQFTMPCDTIAPGQNDICAWVVLAADVNHFNDTSCATMFGIPTIVIDSLHPYCDNFDTLTSIWYNELMPGGLNTTNWEHGAPTYGCINSAHTAPNAWGTNINTGYQNGANVALYTPYFDIQNAFNPYLDFWIKHNTETNWDGVRMEYHTDIMPANQWNIVNPPLDTINWYNMQQTTIICSGLPAWAGTPCTPWIHVHAGDLTSLNLSAADFVQFRFVFCSDGSVIYDGFLIDDFCFKMPAPYDAGVSVILQPAFSAPADSCVPVEVTIKNFGYNVLSNINIYYSKDDIPYGNPVTYGPFLWTGNLQPGGTTNWILPVCDTVPPGAYNFCSWTQLVLPQVDGDATNDTSCTQGIGIPTIPLSYTNSYCDDFNGPNIGWSVQNITPGGQWELGTPAYGTTNTAFSPPNAWDINLNAPYQGLSESMLYSPFFDFHQAANPVMSFELNFNTYTSFDGARCEFSLNGGPWTVLFSQGFGDSNWYNSVACANAAWSGNSFTALDNATANGWAHVVDTLPLSPFSSFNGIVQFRFHWCSSQQFPFPTDGFSMDDFCLIVPVPLTAQPTSCHNTSNPPFIFPGQPISFDTDIRNAGTTPLDLVVAQVILDGNVISSDTVNYSPALPYNGAANHVFTNTWVTAPGVHNVCMVTTYPNQGVDLNPTDDTICCSISVIDTVSVGGGPYCPDFDQAPQWVTLNAFPPYAPNSSWNFGAPNVGFMVGAKTGTNAWKVGPLTGPNGNYPNKDSSALFTPAFNIQVGRTYDLSFWHMYAFEAYQDGGNVEYSTDFGGSWNVLGTGGLPTWYDSYFVTALGGTPPQPGWSIASQVWTNPHHNICFQPQNGQLAYPVMFRFRFASDYSVTNLGWLIDDFCFQDIGPCAVGIDEMPSASGLMLGQNHPNPTNGMTSIEYIIPEKGSVVLNIVNLLGQTIDTPVEADQASGKHTVSFDTDKLSPGIYYYSLTFNKETLVKKMVITK